VTEGFGTQAEGSAKRASPIQHGEGNGLPHVVEKKPAHGLAAAFRFGPMARIVWLQTIGAKNFTGVRGRSQVFPAASKLGVAGRFEALENAGFALHVMVVIVVLVDGEHDGRNVDNRFSRSEGLPDQPVIPASAADGEWGQIGPIETAGKGEVVDPIRGADLSVTGGEVAKFRLPRGAFVGPGIENIDISALADYEEFLVGGGDSAEGGTEIVKQDNVAIDVANDVVAGQLLGFGEDGMEEDRAEFVALDLRLVAKPKFAGDFRGAFVSAEKNDFVFGVKALPALDGIALDDADVAFKGFRDSEERQHFFRIPEKRPHLPRWNGGTESSKQCPTPSVFCKCCI
jgi:hypothetical protein